VRLWGPTYEPTITYHISKHQAAQRLSDCYSYLHLCPVGHRSSVEQLYIRKGRTEPRRSGVSEFKRAMSMRTQLNSKIAVHVPLSQPISQLGSGRAQQDCVSLPALPQIISPTSVAERWASYVLGACRSARDPKTIGIWARTVAVSYTTLCESCRLLGIQPRHARDFTRILRILLIPGCDFQQLASFLNVSDKRTLDAILQKAGFGPHTILSYSLSVIPFLNNQQFIMHDNPGLKVIQNAFAAAPKSS